ncbi:partial [Paramuricea clavata]|uniref:Partial n=1 Tax=Paramuricea clavata TaxID=317549 RepID=A0A7D9JSF2_PARCT|nr:partial [Paramuricea clavata]
MVDQKIFKTAKTYGFDSVYFDECSMELLGKYIAYVRPLLTPTCDYVLVNRNGKQFHKLSNLLSVLVFEAIDKYIHPTRYRQIIETESAHVLLPNEQKWISEDQKHSSNVARVHYQKKRSREVAMRGRECMQKLIERSNSSQTEEEKQQQSSSVVQHTNPNPNVNVVQHTPIISPQKLPKRRRGGRFTCEEDNYIRLGIAQFGFRWSMILRHPEYNFNACRVANTLRKRAEALKLV